MLVIELRKVGFSATSNYTKDREPADLRNEGGFILIKGASVY
jgi:hypothetical protein